MLLPFPHRRRADGNFAAATDLHIRIWRDHRQMDVVNQIKETLKSKQNPTRWDKCNEYDRLIERFSQSL